MAITVDTVLAGHQAPRQLMKVGPTNRAVGQPTSLWYAAGIPGAAAANAAGVNGRACTPGVVTTGPLVRTNPSGVQAFISRVAAGGSLGGSLWLVDRLWENSGLSLTLTTAQSITAAAIPARDSAGTTNGAGVMAGLEYSAAGGAGVPTATLTYTNSGGTAGKTATFVGTASPPAGSMFWWPWAAGDAGVRAPSSFQLSATWTSGTAHLVLFRPLVQIPAPIAGVPSDIDALTGGLPRIYDDSCLQLVWVPSATTATNLFGTFVEAHVAP